MDVNRVLRIFAAALMIVIPYGSSVAQSSHPGYHPAQEVPRDSFVGFALKQINPAGTDYGDCIAKSRSILIDGTVRNAYFWSNVVALCMLGCLFLVIVHQNRARVKHEWASATAFAQVAQALARSNAQIEHITEKNRALTESLASLRMLRQQPNPAPGDATDRQLTRPMRSHMAVTQANAPLPQVSNPKVKIDRPSAISAVPSQDGQIALFKPEVELVTKVNALEQRLGRSQEIEKQLRRKLNEAGRRLQTEQEKMRSLNADQSGCQ
jgi:hypothetical protein